jgi:flagellar basal-body rod protein FlgF
VNDGLISSVATLTTAEKRLEAIASNLANLGTNGFKRTSTASASFDALLEGRVARGVASSRTLDFSQGALRATAEPYDLALHGEGFFAVEGPGGELFTRDGRFVVDDRGVLQTIRGQAVAWDGPRGTIDPVGAPVAVDAEGHVRQGETSIGRIRVVAFGRPELLRPHSGGFFSAPAEATAQPSLAQVRQGHLELANVAAVDELVALIAVQRQFESGTRLMTAIDQSYRRLTNPR